MDTCGLLDTNFSMTAIRATKSWNAIASYDTQSLQEDARQEGIPFPSVGLGSD